MDVNVISKYAFEGEQIPDDVPLEDILLWWELKDLYARFRSGRVTKDYAAKLKLSIIDRHDRYMSQRIVSERIISHHAKMWASIDRAAFDYARSHRTPEADRFYEAVYGCGLIEHVEQKGGEDDQTDQKDNEQSGQSDR